MERTLLDFRKKFACDLKESLSFFFSLFFFSREVFLKNLFLVRLSLSGVIKRPDEEETEVIKLEEEGLVVLVEGLGE